MHNGDRLSGDVIRLEENKLRLKTAYAGTVEIDWTHVRELKMEEAHEVLLDDDTRA